MARDNAAWLRHLSGGSEQHAALTDLREALLFGLRGALSGRAAADESFLEDAVQDALVRILDRLGQFQGRSRFLTWATSIAIRTAMSELRRRRWSDVSLDQVMADADFEPERAFESDSAAGANWERAALLDKMHEVIHTDLTKRQRAALLAELKGMPQDEIARQLGSNRNAVYKLAHDARKKLKQGLEAAGYDAGDVHATAAQ